MGTAYFPADEGHDEEDEGHDLRLLNALLRREISSHGKYGHAQIFKEQKVVRVFLGVVVHFLDLIQFNITISAIYWTAEDIY